MTTTNVRPKNVLRLVPEPSARMSLKPAGGIRGRLDGAWWPRSRDLAAELPLLVAELDQVWGRITRVTVHPGMWPVIPPRIPAGPHTVHLGWFDAEQDPHDLCLLSYTVGRWDLLVIPPECDPETAALLMSAATDVHDTRTASALIAELAPVLATPSDPEPAPADADPTGVSSVASILRAKVARDRMDSWPAQVRADAT
ncbi:hypothetical protein ABIA33_003281 [Streptacidiphilus sp. MAP12-16]|uniref:DUF5994 family protein n=1 Tax=Streptacidiphilus sp. MAP12-16 TaxID=3156300 RepID=UPI0035111133